MREITHRPPTSTYCYNQCGHWGIEHPLLYNFINHFWEPLLTKKAAKRRLFYRAQYQLLSSTQLFDNRQRLFHLVFNEGPVAFFNHVFRCQL